MKQFNDMNINLIYCTLKFWIVAKIGSRKLVGQDRRS